MGTAKENKAAYDAKYIKANIKQRTISFNRNSPEDMELYDWLASKPNGTQYLKDLVREDMKKAGQK